jgi:hypothetical protein
MRSGVMAEFATPDALQSAYEALQRKGYTRIDTWTPYPIQGLLATQPRSPVPVIMLAAALIGGGLGYLLQWWLNLHALRIDVGGRPLHSAPAFIPIAFESAILASALAGFMAMLLLSRLPRLHHPVFEIDGFERASADRFWLGVDEADPQFDARVSDDLARLGALRCTHLVERS